MEKKLNIKKGRFFQLKEWLIELSALFLFTILLVNCQKDNNNEVDTSKYSIYTSGFIWNDGNSPCYWKGTTRTDLPGGTYGAYTTSICASEGNVYTAGYFINNDWRQAPCYWMNTTKIDLPYGNIQDAYTTSIFALNDSVYTAGHYWNGSKGLPCYWVNTFRKELGDNVSGAFISSIFVVDKTVYLGGYRSGESGSSLPCYWIGNTRVDLPTGSSSNGKVNSIKVVDNTVYTCGNYGDMGNLRPCYWVGSVKTDLDASTWGSALSISIDGGTVYTVGSISPGGPCYWKNSSRVGLKGAEAKSICVKDGKVFTAGSYSIPDNGADFFHIPCYWVGTSRVALPIIVNHDHNTTTSIFVE